MPEGPEIWKAADKIAKVVVGKQCEVMFAFESLKQFEGELSGQTVVSLKARGKALLTQFQNGLSIYSHNQLYGRWYVHLNERVVATNRQLRLRLKTPTHTAALYSASHIEVLDEQGIESHAFLRKLGPDVVDADTRLRQVLCQFRNPSFQKRRLQSLLLDQHFLSGLGNYLRSEILFSAKLHPLLRPMDLTTSQEKKLAQECLRLPRQSYLHQGVTNNLERAKELKRNGFKRYEYRHFVFSREGQACFECDTPIERFEIGGRRIYVCTVCQPQQRQK
jgi:endonuclease VIII